VDESEPEAGQGERAEQEEDPAVLIADLPVDQRAPEGDAKPATRRSLRVKGGKADLASLPYKGRPI
jgi:hypothetical protein